MEAPPILSISSKNRYLIAFDASFAGEPEPLKYSTMVLNFKRSSFELFS